VSPAELSAEKRVVMSSERRNLLRLVRTLNPGSIIWSRGRLTVLRTQRQTRFAPVHRTLFDPHQTTL
jgi:hypothetical protein